MAHAPPHSPFARRMIVMRVDERGRRTLLDRTLITEYADGHRDERDLTTADAPSHPHDPHDREEVTADVL